MATRGKIGLQVLLQAKRQADHRQKDRLTTYMSGTICPLQATVGTATGTVRPAARDWSVGGRNSRMEASQPQASNRLLPFPASRHQHPRQADQTTLQAVPFGR